MLTAKNDGTNINGNGKKIIYSSFQSYKQRIDTLLAWFKNKLYLYNRYCSYNYGRVLKQVLNEETSIFILPQVKNLQISTFRCC